MVPISWFHFVFYTCKHQHPIVWGSNRKCFAMQALNLVFPLIPIGLAILPMSNYRWPVLTSCSILNTISKCDFSRCYFHEYLSADEWLVKMKASITLVSSISHQICFWYARGVLKVHRCIIVSLMMSMFFAVTATRKLLLTSVAQ